jgi:hypothetical protein
VLIFFWLILQFLKSHSSGGAVDAVFFVKIYFYRKWYPLILFTFVPFYVKVSDVWFQLDSFGNNDFLFFISNFGNNDIETFIYLLGVQS